MFIPSHGGDLTASKEFPMPVWNEQDQPAPVLPQHPKTQETQDITHDMCPGTDESVTETNEGKNDEKEEKKPFSLSTLILEYLELFVICLGVVLIIFSMMFRICTVSGGSMLLWKAFGQSHHLRA